MLAKKFKLLVVNVVMILVLMLPFSTAFALGGVWHDPYGDDDLYTTLQSERYPRDPKAGENVFIKMNTWPIEPGQSVWIEYKKNGVSQTPIGAAWKYNTSNDTYWEVNLGSFSKGDHIEYTVYADQYGTGRKSVGPFDFKVTDWEHLTRLNSYNDYGNHLVFAGTANTGSYSPSLNLLFEASDVFRLQLSPTSTGTFSTGQALYSISETTSSYEVTTSDLVIRLDKDPFRIRVFKSDGTTLITEHSLASASRNMSWLTDGNGYISQVQDTFATPSTEQFYGFGERYNPLAKRGQVIDNYVFNQYLNQYDKTYLAIPYFVSTNQYGMLINSTYYTKFEMATSELNNNKYRFTVNSNGASSTLLDYSFYAGDDLKEVIANYVHDVALPELTPKWAFGLWLSANEWDRQSEVEGVLNNLSAHQIPASAIVLEQWSDEETFYIWNDATYTAKSGDQAFSASDFTYNGRWTDPIGMIDDIHDAGLRVMLWQNPSQKYTPYAYEQKDNDTAYMLSQNYNVTTTTGEDYRIPPDGWFGNSLVPDFTNAAATEWWLSKREYLLDDMNIDGFKTDGGEIIWGRDTLFSNGKTGDEMRNLFPNYYIKAFYDFAKSKNTEAMSFSRAGTTGIQAYPGVWAGDQDSTFETMRQALRAGLSANISGVPFWSWDVAGFTGDFPNSELYKRSVALGAFTPIMQVHSEKANPSVSEERTPWNAALRNSDPSIISNFRKFANLRMNMLPYIYSEATQTSLTGEPFMRAMAVEYPTDPNTHSLEYQYIFGGSMLVAPIVDQGTNTKSVYLPEGEWIDFFYGALHPGGRTISYYADENNIPVFIKEGSIIPLNLNANYELAGSISNELDSYENLVFRVYPSGNSSYQWHDDIGGGTVGASIKTVSMVEDYANSKVTTELPAMDMNSTVQVYTTKPSTVKINSSVVSEQSSIGALSASTQGWYYDSVNKLVYVKVASSTSARTVLLEGVNKAEYEAEFATHYNVSTNNNHDGYTGTGFVDGFESTSDYIEFEVYVKTAGNYTIDVKYSSAAGTATRDLYVNHAFNSSMSFPTTANWSTWNRSNKTVYLNQGYNKIRLQYNVGNTLGMNVDNIIIR